MQQTSGEELNVKIREIAGDSFIDIPPEVMSQVAAGNRRPYAGFLAAEVRRRGW